MRWIFIARSLDTSPPRRFESLCWRREQSSTLLRNGVGQLVKGPAYSRCDWHATSLDARMTKSARRSGAPSHFTQRTEYIANRVTLPSPIVRKNDEQRIWACQRTRIQ